MESGRGLIEAKSPNAQLAICIPFSIAGMQSANKVFYRMIAKKSPGGSIFPYYYKNGELFGAHYESFTRKEQQLLERMKAEEDFFIRQNHSLPYWVNFYGTHLSDTVIKEFIQSLNRLQRYIPKLAIVGCSVFDKWRLEYARKRTGLNIPIRYFRDPEDAKTWLVSEVFS